MGGSSEVLCSICFEVASEYCDKSVVTLKCSHKFHLDCIGTYFNYRRRMQCPNCRATENGEWRRPENNNSPTNSVNEPVLERATGGSRDFTVNKTQVAAGVGLPKESTYLSQSLTKSVNKGNQEQQIEGPPTDGLSEQQPLSEYATINYAINFGVGLPVAHGSHYGHHGFVHFHHSNIYSSILPAMIGSTSDNHSSMLPFDDTLPNSDGFDNQDTITDYPLTLVNHYPSTMDYETIAIDWNNALQEEMLAVPNVGSNANVRTLYPEHLVHQDIGICSQADSRSQTCQENVAIQITTISAADDADDDEQIIIVSDDE